MLVQIYGSGMAPSQELRDDVEQRIDFALERFRSRIGRVNVFLRDLNGPKNGLDKSCRVVIDIERLPLVVIEDNDDSWIALLDRIAERAAHTVSRQIERIRSRTDRTNMAGDQSESAESAFIESEWKWNPLNHPQGEN